MDVLAGLVRIVAMCAPAALAGYVGYWLYCAGTRTREAEIASLTKENDLAKLIEEEYEREIATLREALADANEDLDFAYNQLEKKTKLPPPPPKKAVRK
jgi:hypothetical protein